MGVRVMIEPSRRSLPAEIPTPLTRDGRLALANELFHVFHGQCFWHSPSDLTITEDLIPFVAKGLRTHGGRRGFVLAGQLEPNPATPADC